MHKFLSAILIFLSSISLVRGQKMYKQSLANFAAIDFPSKPVIFDTLDVQTYRYSDSIADYMVAVKDMSKLEGFQLKSQDLDDFYKGITESVLTADNGKLISQNPFKINGLRGFDMIYIGSHSSLPDLKFKRVLFINGIVISIDFMTFSENKLRTKSARETFFNSLEFTGDKLSLKQETIVSNNDTTYSFSYKLGQLFGYVVIFGFVIWIFRRIRGKKPKA